MFGMLGKAMGAIGGALGGGLTGRKPASGGGGVMNRAREIAAARQTSRPAVKRNTFASRAMTRGRR